MRDIRITSRLVIPEGELVWRFSRSSGPGGQAVNTSSTRVELSFDVERSPSLSPMLRGRAIERLAGRLVDGIITVVASERRSQYQNRLLAEERLAVLLASAVAPPPRPRRPTRPTKASKVRRVESKRLHGEVKRLRGKPPADG